MIKVALSLASWWARYRSYVKLATL